MAASVHILIVEDDADTAANLRDILELDGYQVSAAGSLQATFGRHDWNDIWAVITDRRLPDGNADAHLPRLKQLAPDAGVIVVTGYRDLEGAINCLRAGADDYILKPVNPDELLASLSRIVEHRRAKEALRISEQQRLRLEREVLDASTLEQQRIGRDLHDGLGQELTGIAFLAGVLKQRLQQKKLPEAQAAAEITTLVNQAIEHARALVRGLCPVDLEADGLLRALEQLAESVSVTNRLRCQVVAAVPISIDDAAVATQVYYIAREAVNNAVKHAKAREIVIRLTPQGAEAVLTVEDDGVGLGERAGDGGDGRGLQIMPYRARMIGGSLEVSSRPGKGVLVTCRFNPAAMGRGEARKDERPAAATAGPVRIHKSLPAGKASPVG